MVTVGEFIKKVPVTKENINLDKTVTITYNCENKTFSSTFTLQ